MLNFENIEDLVSYMFENTDNEDCTVSIVAQKETIIDIMQELLNYENVVLNSCEIDYDERYDREYIISLFDDQDSENWYISVIKSFNEDSNKYLSNGGYVLFHEDANSKAIVDMKNNEFTPLCDYDWFIVGEDNTECDTENDYVVNGKYVSKEEFDDYISTFKGANNRSNYTITIKTCDDDTMKEIDGMINTLYYPVADMLYPYFLRFFL